MKLWLLKRVEGLPDEDNPWIPWFNKVAGFVVRAPTAAAARVLANEMSEGEKGPAYELWGDRYGGDLWLEPKYSTCVELTTDGKSEVILRDFQAS